MAKADLTAQRLRDLLDYNPETGAFTWRLRVSQSVRAGDVAGGSHGKSGYLTIRIDYRHYKAHRLAWMHATGEWPRGDIDHINGDTADNRLCNLRDVPTAVNCQNVRRARSSNRSSGQLGVTLLQGRFWVANISVSGMRHYLGCFETAEAAHAAYIEAKRRLHPGNML